MRASILWTPEEASMPVPNEGSGDLCDCRYERWYDRRPNHRLLG